MTIELTRHALKRAHQRLSLKRKSVHRSAELALTRGEPVHRSECTPWLLGNHPSMTSGREVRAYGNAYYVFEHSRAAISLVTVVLAKSCDLPG